MTSCVLRPTVADMNRRRFVLTSLVGTIPRIVPGVPTRRAVRPSVSRWAFPPWWYTSFAWSMPSRCSTGITATSCDDTGLTYDGTIYTYAVKSINNGGADDAKSSPVGPGTQWAAVGQPAALASWTSAACRVQFRSLHC